MSYQYPPQTAPRSSGWLALAIVCSVLVLPFVGYASWCIYDSQVTYPERIARWQAYDQIRQQHGPDAPRVWAEHAHSQGWPTQQPKMYTEHIIVTQYIQGGFCSALGLVAMILAAIGFWLSRRRV